MDKFRKAENLIPNRRNPSPDYFCTWQVQLYATDDGKPEIQRHAINERSLFDRKKPFGWAYFYENARQDLIFLMDSSWDVPYDDAENRYRGSHILSRDKFPSFTKEPFVNEKTAPSESLAKLNAELKKLGWKGLGLWIASQECGQYVQNGDIRAFWKTRLDWANRADISYWKVDNGIKRNAFDFRKELAEAAHVYAPNLYLENAVNDDVIPYSDVFRTYDVPAVLSVPMTLEKIYDKRNAAPPQEGFSCLLNCEDEAYIAAALGFTMGILRHPYAGCFLNGKADMSFPEMHRNLKTKLTEVTRAVRWHRIAPAYTFDARFMKYSDEKLSDTWIFEDPSAEIEDWWLSRDCIKNSLSQNGKAVTKSAPAVLCRNMDLPTVRKNEKNEVPYVVASKNPNGAISVATLGRTFGRRYEIPKCDVTLDGSGSDTFGIFGEYESLRIKTDRARTIRTVLAQDLADDVSYDITDAVRITQDEIVIPGELLHSIGTSAQPVGDTSEPGVVLRFRHD